MRNLGLEVNHDLWGVGENLRDHIAPRMKWKVTQKGVTYNGKVSGLGLGWQMLRYAMNRRGFLGLPAAPMLAFMRTRQELATPDIQLHLVPFRYDDPNKRSLGPEPGMIATSINVVRTVWAKSTLSHLIHMIILPLNSIFWTWSQIDAASWMGFKWCVI